MRDFPYLRLGIRDFKAKSGRDSGLKVCAGGGMPKVTLGITGLPAILGRDYGIEKPHWGPSTNTQGRKQLRRKCCLCNDICEWLDFLVLSDKEEKPVGHASQHFHFNIVRKEQVT